VTDPKLLPEPTLSELRAENAELRRLLEGVRDEWYKDMKKLEDVKAERDRWLARMQKLERRLQLVADAIDSRKEV
jgi:hypothetical protein